MAATKRIRIKTNQLHVKKDLWTHLVYSNPIRTDDFLFRIHYKLSIVILVFVYLAYCRTLQKFGVLSCIFPNGNNNDIMETACFALSVYSIDFNENDIPMVNEAYQGGGGRPGNKPGVVGFADLENIRDNVTYHKYYQFTPFILLVQIIVFVIPRYIWRCYEDGKIAMMCKDLDGPVLDEKEQEKHRKKIKLVAEYFVASLGTNNLYAFVYAGCELLNMFGVVFQLYFLDAVTANVFSTHGFEALSSMMSGYKKDDPFSIGFPTLAKCTVNQYGPGGNNIPHSGVCSLPLNLVTKGYIAWFWIYLVVLTILSGINISYRILTMASFQRRMGKVKEYSLVPKNDLRLVIKSCMYGDWFILKLLAENLDTAVFNQILKKIISQLHELKPNV